MVRAYGRHHNRKKSVELEWILETGATAHMTLEGVFQLDAWRWAASDMEESCRLKALVTSWFRAMKETHPELYCGWLAQNLDERLTWGNFGYPREAGNTSVCFNLYYF